MLNSNILKATEKTYIHNLESHKDLHNLNERAFKHLESIKEV